MSRRRRTKVDERLAPARGQAVHTVEVDGEAVLLDEDSGRLHLLNATGALVWACFDGESTIGEIVTDISEEPGASSPAGSSSASLGEPSFDAERGNSTALATPRARGGCA